MPLWCSTADEARVGKSNSRPHHRIVRIPPGECVVLNSAERTPYVLLIEILNDDLDFDPSERNNKEVLKKIVIKMHEHTDLIPSVSSATPGCYKAPQRPHASQLLEPILGGVDLDRAESMVSPITPTSPSSESNEEIDLVEQLYGTGQLLRS